MEGRIESTLMVAVSRLNSLDSGVWCVGEQIRLLLLTPSGDYSFPPLSTSSNFLSLNPSMEAA